MPSTGRSNAQRSRIIERPGQTARALARFARCRCCSCLAPAPTVCTPLTSALCLNAHEWLEVLVRRCAQISGRPLTLQEVRLLRRDEGGGFGIGRDSLHFGLLSRRSHLRGRRAALAVLQVEASLSACGYWASRRPSERRAVRCSRALLRYQLKSCQNRSQISHGPRLSRVDSA